ncbi:amidase family protein [Streptomyces sp. NPDC046915]|uniref:amidase family protein n=1 Tax=Streptomyces sp. NPDC046915 TaxID=3155257 RepID=UPI0033E5C3BD
MTRALKPLSSAIVRHRTQTHLSWLRANEERLRLRRAWHRFFADARHDVLITPAAPTAAIQAGTRSLTVDGVERSFFDQTRWANLTCHVGLPSLIMPVARNAGASRSACRSWDRRTRTGP